LQLDDPTSRGLVKQAEAHVIIRLFGRLFLILFFLGGCSGTTHVSGGSNCKLARVLEKQQNNVRHQMPVKITKYTDYSN
jgi:hypothetical protein